MHGFDAECARDAGGQIELRCASFAAGPRARASAHAADGGRGGAHVSAAPDQANDAVVAEVRLHGWVRGRAAARVAVPPLLLESRRD